MEFIIDTVDFKEIQQITMAKEEYRKINNKLALQKAEKFVSDDNDKIDIGKLAELSGLDFQGRDAVLFFNGAGETFIRHLNLFLVQGHFQHTEALDRQLKKLTKNEKLFENDEENHKALLLKVLDVKNMDFDSSLHLEEFEADVQNLFQSIGGLDEDVLEYQEEAIKIGKEIIALYSIEGNPINLDPKCAHVLEIFLSLKSLVLPIIKPSSVHPDEQTRKKELINAMKDHDVRVEAFLYTLRNSKETKFRFGEHSDYMHWLLKHAKENYLFTLNKWGLHFSAFLAKHQNISTR